MYAIVNIAGQQFKVQKDMRVTVNRLDIEAGKSVDFKEVFLVDDNGKVKVGTPNLSGAAVSAKVLSHVRGDKVIVFKKKRRKGYAKKNGHRQNFTRVMIEAISVK